MPFIWVEYTSTQSKLLNNQTNKQNQQQANTTTREVSKLKLKHLFANPGINFMPKQIQILGPTILHVLYSIIINRLRILGLF